MSSPVSPLVSVVTPFYNTARWLPECIESVLAQTFQDFEYILVDNCSTDGSGEIAARYAARDPRVRLVRNPDLLGQVENYNFALSCIGPHTRWCKLVQADDWIYPDCLHAMLDVAARDPSIGLVAAYALRGTSLRGEGLEVGEWLIPGRRAARIQMLEDRFFLGSPTSVMYRSDIVRARRPFYDLGRYHEDTELGYEILKTHALGFVHQVLSYQRVEDSSSMGRRRTYQPHLLDRLIVLERYGLDFLTPEEFARAHSAADAALVRFLGASLLRLRDAQFWRYQAGGYATMGRKLPRGRILLSALNQLLDLLLNPKRTAELFVGKLRGRAARWWSRNSRAAEQKSVNS